MPDLGHVGTLRSIPQMQFMKTFGLLTASLLLAGFFAARAWAGPDDVPLSAEQNAKLNRTVKDQFDVQIRELLKDVDSMIVRYLPPSRGQETRTATLNDASVIRGLVAQLRAKLPQDEWFKGPGEGEVMADSVNCQCWGDFEFSFFRKNELVGKFSVHHWKHLRSESLNGGSDTGLEIESLDHLYALAARLLPPFAIRKPDPPIEPTAKAAAPR